MKLVTVIPTTLLLSLCAGLAACSSSADSPIHLATDAGSGSASDAAKSGTDAASGSSSAASSSGAGSSSASSAGSSDAGGTACAADAGTTIPAKWDFTVSAPAADGGPGQVLTARVCDTVVWTNDDNGTPHSVVSDTSSTFQFMTPTVSGTATGAVIGSVQFTKAGTFGYHCGIHPTTMTGQITVQ